MIPETENPQEEASIRCMVRLIRANSLRKDYHIGFLAERLNYDPTRYILGCGNSFMTDAPGWTHILLVHYQRHDVM